MVPQPVRNDAGAVYRNFHDQARKQFKLNIPEWWREAPPAAEGGAKRRTARPPARKSLSAEGAIGELARSQLSTSQQEHGCYLHSKGKQGRRQQPAGFRNQLKYAKINLNQHKST